MLELPCMIDLSLLIHFFRAVFFGVSVGITISLFFRYFKPIVEDFLVGKFINVDLWWWTGVTLSIILGILSMLFLL